MTPNHRADKPMMEPSSRHRTGTKPCAAPSRHDNCEAMTQGALFDLTLPPSFSRFHTTDIEPAITAHLESAEAALRNIERGTGWSYEETLGALEAATERLELAMGLVEHLESVASTPELRDAYNAVLPAVSGFWAQIPLRPGIWDALCRLNDNRDRAQLSPTKRRLLDKTLDDFRRHGAGLPDSAKARLREIETSLSQLTAKYSQNVLDSTNAFELLVDDPSALAGLPPSALEAARHSALSKGATGYRLTLQAPSVTAVLTYADDAALRERIWRAHGTRGVGAPFDNVTLIPEILRLRREKATILGFSNFASFALEPRMAKTDTVAQRFVHELRDRTIARFKRESEELLEFRRSLEGPSAPELMPWDVAYYAEKLRHHRYEFDEEALRAYFGFERTLTGLLSLCERLFGIRFEPATGIDTWDPEVGAYHVVDGTRQLGTFYVDPYPRDSKGGGAWMHGIVSATATQPGLAAVVCNATAPTDQRPSLLTHREVETLFHEFGHLLHHLLSQVEVRSLAGTRVAQDFVELPSQIMENWCWEREALDAFARHYQTGERIPAELFERLQQVRTFRAATTQMRQLGFAALDLALHIEYDEARDGDVLAYARKIHAEYSAAPLPDDYALVASFTHLFAHPVGYAAGYYSYKWAEVLDADAFGRFAAEGIFNAEVGRAWRRCVLERGDSEEPMVLFEDFVGRRPDPEALLRRQGLL